MSRRPPTAAAAADMNIKKNAPQKILSNIKTPPHKRNIALVQHNNYNYKNALDVLGFTLGQGDDLLAGGVVSRAAHNQNYPSPNAAHSRYNEL